MTQQIDQRRLRAGIVGGGRGAFIGAVHRMAAELDGESLVVAGALSSNPANASASAADWRLARSYSSYAEMARAEASASEGIDYVIIATPNHLHVPVARAFIEAGIHVVCDKLVCVSANSLPRALTRLPSSRASATLSASGGKSFKSAQAGAVTRVPAGHPEGYIEAFATLYRAFAADVRRVARGEPPQRDYPGIDDGVRGLEFVAAAIASSSRGSAWVSIP